MVGGRPSPLEVPPSPSWVAWPACPSRPPGPGGLSSPCSRLPLSALHSEHGQYRPSPAILNHWGSPAQCHPEAPAPEELQRA